MAASPPLLGGETTPMKSPATATMMMQQQRTDLTKSARGLNKPKCIQCGNVARSRCPFQCCKSCCAKAQNPCHIHVLKPNATLADRGAPTNSPAPQPQPSEAPSAGPTAKVSSLRQLSSTFAQFNNLHVPLRSRKPITKKEALATNEWRFAKLKEYRERNIEAENEAFDRYMQNISLLEEIFDVSSERQDEDGSVVSNLPTTSSDKAEITSEMKVKLRSNPVRVDKFRKRTQQAVDQGLRKLRRYEISGDDSAHNQIEEGVLGTVVKAAESWRIGKTSALADLNDRLSKVRNAEDLKPCMQIMSKIRGQQKVNSQKKTESSETPKEQTVANGLPPAEESVVSPLKPVKTTKVNQDVLNSIDMYFSSVEEIEDL